MRSAALGGRERYQGYIAEHLDKSRFEAVILCPRPGVMVEQYRRYMPTHIFSETASTPMDKVRERVVGSRLVPSSLRTLAYLWSKRAEKTHQRQWALDLMRDFQPDLLVFQHNVAMPHYEDLDGLEVPSVQQIAWPWSWLVHLSDSDMRRLASRSHYVCEGVGAPTYTRDVLGVPAERISTVRMGIDLGVRDRELDDPDRPSRSSLGIPPGAIVIVSVGHFVFVKGPDLWLKAAAILRARYPERTLRFVWVGVSKSRRQTVQVSSLLRLVEEYRLGDAVVLADEHPSVYPYLELSDIYVQASRDDAFPHTPLEAMAMGKPVVSTPHGVALDDISEGALLRVDVTTAEALADGIGRLIESEDLRAQLGQAGRRLIDDHFHLPTGMRQYEDVLEQVAERAKPLAEV